MDSVFSPALFVTILLAIIGIIATFVLARYTDYLKQRKTTVGIRQNISQVVDPKMLIKPEIVFNKDGRDFRYRNLFIIESHFVNSVNIRHNVFDVSITFRIKDAEVIFADCSCNGSAHKGQIRQPIGFATPSKMIDIDLFPFNPNDRCSLTLYIICPGNEQLTNNDIRYDSSKHHRFKAEIGRAFA
jgi:hypothetical protein